MLPFTTNQFLEVFANYNNAIYPAQWVLILAALAAVIFTLSRNLKKLAVIILAILWKWAGIVYHLMFFTRINGAAFFFGFLFILQSLIFVYFGAIKGAVRFLPRFNARGIAGLFCIIYALVVYPFFNEVGGHRYPLSPSFGVPCPVTIFTFGLLMWTDLKVPLQMLAIPFLWIIIAFSAVIFLGMYEDVGLLGAGLTYFIFWSREESKFRRTAVI